MSFKLTEEGRYQLLGDGDNLYMRLDYIAHKAENYTWYSYVYFGWQACNDELSNELDKKYEEQYAS